MPKCSAPNCEHSLRRGHSDFSFHEFPEDPDLCRRWLANIGRANWTPGRRSTICSAHFEETQLEKNGEHIQLLKTAVPTIFSTAKRKKGSKCQKYSKVRVVNYSPDAQILIEGTDSVDSSVCLTKINQQPLCIEIKEEDACSLSPDFPNKTHGLGLHMETTKSFDELTVIDEPYILEDCKLVNNDNLVHNFQSNAGNLGIEETVELADETPVVIYQELSTSGAHENVVIIEQSALNQKSTRVINSESSDLSGEVCRQLLNLSDAAAPRLYSSLSSVASETYAVETTPASHFSTESCVHSKKEELCSSESKECHEDNVTDTTPQIQPILEGLIDLPAASHKHRQISLKSSDVRWQIGTFMCRLCGVTSDKTINLFSSEAIECELLERILSFLHIEIVQSDDLPQSVCSVCLSKLDTCSELIFTSFNTHQFLASVTNQDEHNSTKLPVYYSIMDKKAPRNPGLKRHILLMEMYHEKERPVEEYLTAACNDLQSRLNSKDVNSTQCNLLLSSISDSCCVSQVEQARTVAEALIVKGLIQCGMQRKQEKVDAWDTSFNQDQANSEIFSDNLPFKECFPPEELTEAVDLDLLQSQVLPSLDDVTFNPLTIMGARCVKLTRPWYRRKIVFKNMQRSFLWQEQEDGMMRLICRHCNKAFERHCNFLSHLENCNTQSLTNRVSHLKCHVRAPEKNLESLPKLLSNEDQTLCESQNQKLSCRRYQCSYCSARLQSRAILHQHLSQHHASNSTKCEGCGYETIHAYEATLHRHRCTQVRTNEWHSPKGLEIFPAESKLQEHQASTGHSNDIPCTWLCDVCGKKYTVAAKLNEHKKCHLPPECKNIHKCSQCPKKFINLSRLKEHMQRHEEKKFMCKVCGKLFGTKQILRQHESTHGEPQYLCALCSRTFYRKGHLLKHMNVHNPLNPRTSRCGPPPHRDGLNRCRECRNVFENNLLEHYKTCHPHISLHNYVCEVCKIENTSYAELFQHQREAHKTGVKDCPFCNKTIDGSTQMKYHLMKHEGMFPYNCPLCCNGYTANSLLQDHMRRKHTGEKPFQCQQCSKCFPTNGALAQHSTVHSLPHQLLPCPVCNQGFKRKAHLDVHLRTHTGEKPYPCPICDRPFRQRPDCVKHVRVIHGEDPSKFKFQFNSNASVTFPQELVSVAEIELVLEGEDLMQTSLASSNMTFSQ